MVYVGGPPNFTFRLVLTIQRSRECDLTISLSGTWEIVGGKLVITIYAARETASTSDSYTIRGDRLTLVDDDDGFVEIWERR